MQISVVKSPPSSGNEKTLYLEIDNWDDFDFRTSFFLHIFEGDSIKTIGRLKIGYKNQPTNVHTSKNFQGTGFNKLEDDFFSLGRTEEYYKNLSTLEETKRNEILKSLNDLVINQEKIQKFAHESVLNTSLFRGKSLSTITNTFAKILKGDSALTNFEFIFDRQKTTKLSNLKLIFDVKAGSTPSTNIHAIIGRNGIGKTTILNNIIDSIINKNTKLFYEGIWGTREEVNNEFFSTLISVSFSAFDQFQLPKEQSNPALGTCYYYIGLKYIYTPKEVEIRKKLLEDLQKMLFEIEYDKLNHAEIKENEIREKLLDDLKNAEKIKTRTELNIDFINAFSEIKADTYKTKKWKEAIISLESDVNFKEFKLLNLIDDPHYKETAHKKISDMSSGHSLVLLTITRLVERVEEKSLVLIDEPESHLHPPLLSAFIRALSNLLTSRNAVALIATHSPVVLQEIPNSCVSMINRTGSVSKTKFPNVETFGENVGVLTRDVFGLEVEKSGFYDLLNKEVEAGKKFHKIIEEYDGQLGNEGRVVLASLIASHNGGENAKNS